MSFHCVFSLRNRRFALPLDAVREMTGETAPVPVPWAPPCLLGLIQLRGRLFPQLELSSFLGALPPQRTETPRQMIVETGDLRFIAPVDRMDIRDFEPGAATPHPGSSLHPALDAAIDLEDEKIELIHLERLRCALERELRFAELTA